ncbi:MAG: ATP-binding cassette domain-containing protein [Anaerolineae bacterium]|nr:ATP-binding cassette domain-containing protein [Anaerolineae bacterium]
MATIRLQDVTRIFPPARLFGGLLHGGGVYRGQSDRAFAERVSARSAQEHDLAGHKEPVVALDHVNLTIPNGQTFAIVGPSGCGKSTLLRVVAGLDTDYSGHVFYDDRDMRDVPPGDRYIGMVFQNYALYPHFEGHGNLAFFFRVHKVADRETEERIRITSEVMGFGFEELLKRKPGTLSGGQQQRLAIARAIVRNPRLFLFDEPLSNLDAKLRVQTRIEIKRLLRQFQITSIYVTHDQVEAITLGDQVAVMRQGRIEQVGPYQELRQHPINTFVAEFLGSPPMNLFHGGTVADGELHLGEFTVPLPEAVRHLARSGQTVTLGVRPEAALALYGGRVLPEGVRIRGVVEVIEPAFARRTQLLHLRTGSRAYVVTGELDQTLNRGDEIEALFPFAHLYFFDGTTGRRLG